MVQCGSTGQAGRHGARPRHRGPGASGARPDRAPARRGPGPYRARGRPTSRAASSRSSPRSGVSWSRCAASSTPPRAACTRRRRRLRPTSTALRQGDAAAAWRGCPEQTAQATAAIRKALAGAGEGDRGDHAAAGAGGETKPRRPHPFRLSPPSRCRQRRCRRRARQFRPTSNRPCPAPATCRFRRPDMAPLRRRRSRDRHPATTCRRYRDSMRGAARFQAREAPDMDQAAGSLAQQLTGHVLRLESSAYHFSRMSIRAVRELVRGLLAKSGSHTTPSV